MLQADADSQRFKNHMIFKKVDNFNYIMRYGFPAQKEIREALVCEHADFVKSELELMDTDEERELPHEDILVDWQGHHRAYRYMLGAFESVSSRTSSREFVHPTAANHDTLAGLFDLSISLSLG